MAFHLDLSTRAHEHEVAALVGQTCVPQEAAEMPPPKAGSITERKFAASLGIPNPKIVGSVVEDSHLRHARLFRCGQ